MPGMNAFCLGGRRPETPIQLQHTSQTIDGQILDSANGLDDELLSGSDGEATKIITVPKSLFDLGVPCAESSTAQAQNRNITGSQGAKGSKSQQGKVCQVKSTGSKLEILKQIWRYLCFPKAIKTVRPREASKSSTSHTPTTEQLGERLIDLNGLAEGGNAHKPPAALSRSLVEVNPDLTVEAQEATSNISHDGKSERETALCNINGESFAHTEASTSPWPPLPADEQREKKIPRPLETAQILSVPNILGPVFNEQTKTQGDLDPDRHIMHTLEVEDSQQPQSGAPSILQDATYLPHPYDDFKTTFRMVIHRGDGQVAQRVGKLDTGSKVNVISKQVVTSLGLPMEPYKGPFIAPIGAPVHPVGETEIDWHVASRGKTYTTKFAVLDDNLTKDFDALLSEDTVKEIGFYKVNNTVWLANVEVLSCQ